MDCDIVIWLYHVSCIMYSCEWMGVNGEALQLHTVYKSRIFTSSSISELVGKAFWCNQVLPHQLYPSDGYRHSPTQPPLPCSIWTVSSLVPSSPPQLSSLAVWIFILQVTIAVVEDWEWGYHEWYVPVHAYHSKGVESFGKSLLTCIPTMSCS